MASVVGEESPHFFLALDVLLLCVAETLGIVDVCVGVQTDEPIVRRSVLLHQKMRVVRSDDLDLVFRRQVEERGVDFPLIVVDFQGETRISVL